MPKSLAFCAPRPERNTETEFWRNKKNGFKLCLAKEKTQQASVSRTVPLSLGNRERFYIPQKVLLFFYLLQDFKMVTAGIRQLGLLFLKLSASDLLFEMQNATRECRQGRLPGAENSSYESQRAISFVQPCEGKVQPQVFVTSNS